MTTSLIRNANIFTPVDKGRPASGSKQGELRHIQKGAFVVQNGNISQIGPEKAILTGRSCPPKFDKEIDCQNRCVIPGFVDPHTHMCFAARREKEFDLRLSGTPYLEILAKGGGILSSVRAVRSASHDALAQTTRSHVLSAMRMGTTTLEIKSGYGLDNSSEIKMLEVIDRIGHETPLDVVPTFLGAHAIPEEYRHHQDAYVDRVIYEMLPAVKRQRVARYCDVFCETGAFSIPQARQILEAARALGLGLKLHADEVHDTGGAGLAAAMHADSADHLLASSIGNLKRMAQSGTIAVLLPATAYSLRKDYARARDMITINLPVSVATDCNPGSSYTESMPFVIGLAVLNMSMTPSEALVAATLNAAYAIGMPSKTGSLDVGKQADFLILDGESPTILAYHAGTSPVEAVYKKGMCVYEKNC